MFTENLPCAKCSAWIRGCWDKRVKSETMRFNCGNELREKGEWGFETCSQEYIFRRIQKRIKPDPGPWGIYDLEERYSRKSVLLHTSDPKDKNIWGLW